MADIIQNKKKAALAGYPATQGGSQLSQMDMPGANTSVGDNSQVQEAVLEGQDNSPAETEEQRLSRLYSDPANAGKYVDPGTGQASEQEPNLEEGDLYLDYVAPVRNLFTGGLAAAGRMAANAAGKKGIGSLRDRMPAKEGPPLNWGKGGNVGGVGPGDSGYTAQYKLGGAGGQQGVGSVTDATTGFSRGPGYRLKDK